MLVRTTAGVVRLPVGTNGQVIQADSANANGVVWATPAAAGGDVLYINNGGIFVASGAGITFAKAGGTWDVNIPAGVRIKTFKLHATAGQFPGTGVTINFNNTNNTVTNQGWATAEPPIGMELWHMEAGARFVYETVNTGSTAGMNVVIQPLANNGNISLLCTLPAGITGGEILIAGIF
jgi:hypothetical protein